MIVQILFILIHLVKGWHQSNLFQLFLNQTNQLIFQDYFILKTTIIGTECLVIFGGRRSTKLTSTFQNNLYTINLATRAVTELALTGPRPSPRCNPCGTIVRDRLIIYGGSLEDGTFNNELWQYDILNDRWSLRGTSQTLQKCAFMTMNNQYENDTVTVIGLKQTNRTLSFIEYDIFKRSLLTNITINYFTSITKNATLWDGSIIETTLRLQGHSEFIRNHSLQSQQQVQLPIKYFCLYTVSPNNYTLVTNNGKYFVEKVNKTYRVGFLTPRNMQEIDRLDCLNTNDWVFSIYAYNQQKINVPEEIYIQYIHLPSLTQGVIHNLKKSLYVDWIAPVWYYNVFMKDGTIFVVNQNLEVSYLTENCGNFTEINPNVLKCTYGMYSCKEGWTGKTCDIPQCAASMRVYDKNSLAQIDISCSGNGECSSTGCVCKQNWRGEGCEIYSKKNCKGTLIDNFVQSNCECNEPTTGGNECTVVFCYNDCSGHGECQSDGKCECNQNYKGPDCSILEINFDRIE